MPTYMVSANRLGIILGLAQFAFLLIVVKQFSTELGGLVTIISFAAVSIFLFFAFAALVVSIARFPIPLDTRNRLSSAVLPIICSILMLVSVWYHSRFLWISPGGTTVYDVRFALVIAAIFYLTSRVVSVPRGALTLDILTTIRREFLLGRIELDTAFRQADIALVGMRASDLLEDFVAKLLSLYRDANAEFTNSTSLLDQLKKVQSDIREKALPEQVDSMDQLLVALDSSVEKVHNILTLDIPRAYRPIERRLIPLSYLGFLKDSNDIQELKQKLKDSNDTLSKQAEDFRTEFINFCQIIQLDES